MDKKGQDVAPQETGEIICNGPFVMLAYYKDPEKTADAIRDGQGARVRDEDGTEYVDLLIGSGPMLLGHGHPEVMEAVLEQLPKGMTFFASNAAGIELAEEICRAVNCAEQVRYVSSGGEADMYAIRLARAFTGRDRIVKFEGGYHGMSNLVMWTREFDGWRPGEPEPPIEPYGDGIPAVTKQLFHLVPMNDANALEDLLKKKHNEIGAFLRSHG